jgi:hypothetical protein
MWLHVKDYRRPPRPVGGHLDEEAVTDAVPADRGDVDHRRIFADLKAELPRMNARLQERGIPGVFVDIEPHLKGGGQFGGFSGPDGYGVALRALCLVLDDTGVSYHLTGFDDLRRLS